MANEELEKKEAEGEDDIPPEALETESAEEKKSDAKAESRVGEARSKAGSDPDIDEAGELDRREKQVETALAPTQLGYKRFVYAAYFGAAIAVAFIGSKAGNMIWYRLSQWKPQWELGDPKDEIIMPLGAVVGILVALYYYRKPKSRQYIDEVANELSQVTWPSRKEVTNSTAVVIATTLFATVFFALMDRFWGFVTNLVYGS
jgi:preprotein translocase subunit SecE